MLKRTPLFEAHRRLGARLVEFGGWEMPVQYSSIIEEHQAVRTAAGLFDISHMGEILVTGPDAAAFLNRVLTNDIQRLEVDQAQYSILCNDSGGTIDDLYVYHISAESYLLVVNASRTEADLAWLEKQPALLAQKDVALSDCSSRFGALALQGPASPAITDHVFPEGFASFPMIDHASQLKKNQITSVAFSIGTSDHGGFVARTGYTGEDGFEVIAPAEIIEPLWERILNAGTPQGLKPAGLGARDTLRTEACYPLYGHELDESTTPVEAGLSAFIAFHKPDFAGRAKLLEQKQNGPPKKCAAFKMTGKSPPPRPGYTVWTAGSDRRKIGEVTSGTQSPSLGIGIGMAFVRPEHAQPGTLVEIEVRGKFFPAQVVSRPIYKKAV